jgi:hypothetical protein
MAWLVSALFTLLLADHYLSLILSPGGSSPA